MEHTATRCNTLQHTDLWHIHQKEQELKDAEDDSMLERIAEAYRGESCHTYMSHVGVTNEHKSRTSGSRHTYLSHVTHTWVISESWISSSHERVICSNALEQIIRSWVVNEFRAIIEVNRVIHTRVMSEYEYRMSSSHERVLCFIAYFRAIIEVNRVMRTRVVSEYRMLLSHERVRHVTHTSVMSHIYELCLSLEWLRVTNEWVMLLHIHQSCHTYMSYVWVLTDFESRTSASCYTYVSHVTHIWFMSESWMTSSHERVSHVTTHTSVMSHIYELCLSLEWLWVTNECFASTQSSGLA